MRIIRRITLLLLLSLSIFILSGCSKSELVKLDEPDNQIPSLSIKNEENEHTWGELKPNINIVEIGGSKPNEDVIEVVKGSVDIENIVFTFIETVLTEAGFDASYGIAMPVEEQTDAVFGLYYYMADHNIYMDDDIMACGFVEVIETTDTSDFFEENEHVVVVDQFNPDDDMIYLLSYNYTDIGYGHFVYQDKYVKFYQQSDFKVVYEELENIKDNYDLNYGSLYDYDNNMFLYDESIFDKYKNHSAIELFSVEDYQRLEDELVTLSNKQLANGYQVEEYKIVYISPESIQTYLSSNEEDTFFGYSVKDLTAQLGVGKALSFNGQGFVELDGLDEGGYNWRSFLTKVAIGSGIIIAGAVLAPITGGASFTCALITISKVAFSFALSAAVGTLVIETCVGLVQGKTVLEALEDATYKGLDSFANGLIIGAVIGSVGVLTGAIKPGVCFIAGTLVLTNNIKNKYVNIEDVEVGDYVYSYNEFTGNYGSNKVTDVFINKTNKLIKVSTKDGDIYATENHPFYLADYEVWVRASSLNKGDVLKDADNNKVIVNDVTIIKLDEEVDVYNFTVENDHTYFVGDAKVLVHNHCDTAAELRKREKGGPAQRKAVKNEIEAIRNGTNKMKYSDDLVAAIQDQSKSLRQVQKEFAGEFAAHHIIPVSKINNAKLDPSLVRDPENLLVMPKADHELLHSIFGGPGNAANMVTPEYQNWLIKYAPHAARQIVNVLTGLI